MHKLRAIKYQQMIPHQKPFGIALLFVQADGQAVPVQVLRIPRHPEGMLICVRRVSTSGHAMLIQTAWARTSAELTDLDITGAPRKIKGSITLLWQNDVLAGGSTPAAAAASAGS